jgi:SAM-dependent methyltransferase
MPGTSATAPPSSCAAKSPTASSRGCSARGRPPAGRALDLACGEGRNAIWLANRGWKVTAIDYSQVAIDRARELADRPDGGVHRCFVEAAFGEGGRESHRVEQRVDVARHQAERASR